VGSDSWRRPPSVLSMGGVCSSASTKTVDRDKTAKWNLGKGARPLFGGGYYGSTCRVPAMVQISIVCRLDLQKGAVDEKTRGTRLRSMELLRD